MAEAPIIQGLQLAVRHWADIR